MTTAFYILHFLTFMAVALRVLSRPDLISSIRIVWIFVLLALPIAGAILYLIVGEVRFAGRSSVMHARAVKATHSLVAASGAPPDLPRWGAASGFATSINGFGVTEGNRAELLDSPERARERLIQDIDEAKESVSVLYYIWLDDRTGRATAEAIMRAARRGVRCRAMVDAIGSRAFTASQTWKDLVAAGVETAIALPLGNPFHTMLRRRLDLRNHRKISVIDDRIVHCGSQNCADPEFLPKRHFAPWVDIMVRFEGPIARQMHLLFTQDWMAYREADLSEFERPVKRSSKGVSAQVVGTGPTISREITTQLFSRVIADAKRELIISTPYFVPGDTVCSAITGAARAGVQTTLIVPRRNDSGFVARASRSYYPRLIDAGVRIVEFNGGLLHSKTMTVDGALAFIGSSNLDIRSFDLNFENDILLHDKTLTEAIRGRQMDYVASSTPVDPETVRRWPLYRRIWFNLFDVLGPVL